MYTQENQTTYRDWAGYLVSAVDRGGPGPVLHPTPGPSPIARSGAAGPATPGFHASRNHLGWLGDHWWAIKKITLRQNPWLQAPRRIGRAARTIAPTAGGAALGLIYFGINRAKGNKDATCGFDTTHFTIVCSGLNYNASIIGHWQTSGYFSGGTTYGSVFITSQRKVDKKNDWNNLLDHEENHSDQWAEFGPGFIPGYLIANQGGKNRCNVFERWAGFKDEGYNCR